MEAGIPVRHEFPYVDPQTRVLPTRPPFPYLWKGSEEFDILERTFTGLKASFHNYNFNYTMP